MFKIIKTYQNPVESLSSLALCPRYLVTIDNGACPARWWHVDIRIDGRLTGTRHWFATDFPWITYCDFLKDELNAKYAKSTKCWGTGNSNRQLSLPVNAPQKRIDFWCFGRLRRLPFCARNGNEERKKIVIGPIGCFSEETEQNILQCFERATEGIMCPMRILKYTEQNYTKLLNTLFSTQQLGVMICSSFSCKTRPRRAPRNALPTWGSQEAPFDARVLGGVMTCQNFRTSSK